MAPINRIAPNRPPPPSFLKADSLRLAPHVYQQSSRRLDVVVCSLGAGQRCRETQVSQFHVFMVRQTASQNHRDAHVHDRSHNRTMPAGPKTYPGNVIKSRAPGRSPSDTRQCRTTGRSSSACTLGFGACRPGFGVVIGSEPGRGGNARYTPRPTEAIG